MARKWRVVVCAVAMFARCAGALANASHSQTMGNGFAAQPRLIFIAGVEGQRPTTVAIAIPLIFEGG